MHIGEEQEVLITNIIGIFDVQLMVSLPKSKYQIIQVSDGSNKSAILVHEKDRFICYMSPISTMTLNKRWQNLLKSI